jgi:hypothetical protein
MADTMRGPLSTRAWTLQEEILSPRVLRFLEQQVVWRCSMYELAEYLPWRSEYPRSFDGSDAFFGDHSQKLANSSKKENLRSGI